MIERDDEERLLRSVAIQNANAILLARRRAENELVRAKEALEVRTGELAHSLAMMRATLESTTDGILVTNEHGAVTDFNERYLAMWRLPREEVERSGHFDLLQAVGAQFADARSFVVRVEEIDAEAPAETFDVLQLADGRVFERLSRTQVVQGRNVGRVWSFRDITENRRLLESERAARTSAERASSMKDEFLATLSHELRTPLSALLGWSQMLRLPTAGAADVRRGLEMIERNARVQKQLIDDLLDMNLIASGKLRLEIQPVSPASFIEAALETVRPAADAKGIRLTAVMDPAAGPIAGDPNRLQQVVWNLLSNAIKFTGKHGRVQVALRRVNSHIEICVEDGGIGITPEFLPYVFDRFRQADASTTRAAGGLGLGLAIVKQLVELHGGTVRATSAGQDRGATFTVELPRMAVHDDPPGGRHHPTAGQAAAQEFKRLDLAGVTVLVVDDEADARDLVALVLTECRAGVVTAGTAEEALAAVERYRPDVMVSDVGMPDVDGYELLKRVRGLGHARGGSLPAVALTAFARSEDRTRALRAGYLLHIAKPVEPTELAAAVASVVGRTGPQ
ncbi:MAG TPA: ATP-binding protein [Candidatus Limnocylindria bacterium]|nr:ATP-binding protein [Candidatus Limnocylindria bacterium]